MSEIITAYPTSGLADRSLNSLNTAFFEHISSIPEIAEFFDSVEKLGDGSTTTYSDYGIKFKKGNAYIRMNFDNSSGNPVKFSNNSASGSSSSYSSGVVSNDIPIRHVTGINGTTAIWLDDYIKGACMMFNRFDDKFFLASSSSSSNSWYYSDTGGTVKSLTKAFNGSNIGTGGDFIAQPYYHLGINTGDIYTFDGGSTDIPWGKFKLKNAEFVRLYNNFALRIS